uniref:Conopeptide n=1 Tax=Conus lenavati TaxID=1519839 RepID=A0A0K8TUZ8_CONLV
MLRLIIAAVLATACLAFPQRRDGLPGEAANLKPFGPDMQGMQAMPGAMPGPMPNMQPMQAMPGQFLPFNPNLGMGFKRAADENLEKRKHHSKFQDENKSPFDSPADSLLGNFNFGKFLQENPDNIPFANMENANPGNLGNFEPNAEDSKEGHFRFFDQQQ